MRRWNLLLASAASAAVVALVLATGLASSTAAVYTANSVPTPQLAQVRTVAYGNGSIIIIGSCVPKLTWTNANTTLIIICPPPASSTATGTITPYTS